MSKFCWIVSRWNIQQHWLILIRFKIIVSPRIHQKLHTKNCISQSIAWDKIAELKDFTFTVKMSAMFLWFSGRVERPSQAATGFKGIHNEGATCYINSLLQSLFCINKFRRIIYSIPIEPKDVDDSFVFWLKYLFYVLQFDTSIDARTLNLIKCFDWTEMNTTSQQDIHEFLRRLLYKLDQFVGNTEMKKCFAQLFAGNLEITTSCKNVDHQSNRIETFWDIQLPIDDDNCIYDGFRTYLKDSSITE